MIIHVSPQEMPKAEHGFTKTFRREKTEQSDIPIYSCNIMPDRINLHSTKNTIIILPKVASFDNLIQQEGTTLLIRRDNHINPVH